MFELILPHLPPGLQEAILSPKYSEVCVNEGGRVFVEAAGSNTMQELTGITPTQQQLRQAVNTIARILARREADETNPILDARLPDGSRVAAMLPPVTEGIVLTVRKFRPNWFTLDELAANGTLSFCVCNGLRLAVGLRQNILISGSTGVPIVSGSPLAKVSRSAIFSRRRCATGPIAFWWTKSVMARPTICCRL
jgi:pilus assembly protein CpaF